MRLITSVPEDDRLPGAPFLSASATELNFAVSLVAPGHGRRYSDLGGAKHQLLHLELGASRSTSWRVQTRHPRLAVVISANPWMVGLRPP